MVFDLRPFNTCLHSTPAQHCGSDLAIGNPTTSTSHLYRQRQMCFDPRVDMRPVKKVAHVNMATQWWLTSPTYCPVQWSFRSVRIQALFSRTHETMTDIRQPGAAAAIGWVSISLSVRVKQERPCSMLTGAGKIDPQKLELEGLSNTHIRTHT